MDPIQKEQMRRLMKNMEQLVSDMAEIKGFMQGLVQKTEEPVETKTKKGNK